MESINRESIAGAALSVLSLMRLIEKAAILKKKNQRKLQLGWFPSIELRILFYT